MTINSILANHANFLYQASLQMMQFYFKHNQVPQPNIDNVAPILKEHGACFVTLEKQGRLRGCVGTIEAHRPIIIDVMANTIGAAFMDKRFAALSVGECKETTISYSLLTPKKEIYFSNEQELLGLLRPHIDGLVIEDNGKRAVYLPSVWEQIPDKIQFLSNLRLKAGMEVNHFSPTLKAYTYQADKTTPLLIQQ